MLLKNYGEELLRLVDAMQTVFSGVTTLEPKIWNTFNRVDQDLMELDGQVNCRKDDQEEMKKLLTKLSDHIDSLENTVAIQNDTIACMDKHFDKQSKRLVELEEKAQNFDQHGDKHFISLMEFNSCLINYNQRMESVEGRVDMRDEQVTFQEESRLTLCKNISEVHHQACWVENKLEDISVGLDHHLCLVSDHLKETEERVERIECCYHSLSDDLTLEEEHCGDVERGVHLVRRDLEDAKDDMDEMDTHLINLKDILTHEQHCFHCPNGSPWVTLILDRDESDSSELLHHVAGPSAVVLIEFLRIEWANLGVCTFFAQGLFGTCRGGGLPKPSHWALLAGVLGGGVRSIWPSAIRRLLGSRPRIDLGVASV